MARFFARRDRLSIVAAMALKWAKATNATFLGHGCHVHFHHGSYRFCVCGGWVVMAWALHWRPRRCYFWLQYHVGSVRLCCRCTRAATGRMAEPQRNLAMSLNLSAQTDTQRQVAAARQLLRAAGLQR